MNDHDAIVTRTEKVIAEAFRQVHHQDPARTYSVGEVKQIVHPLVHELRMVVDHRMPDSDARNFAWAKYRKDYAPNHLTTAHNAFLAGWEAALSGRWVTPTTDAPQHEHEWEHDRSVCGFCGGNHGYCECGETEPCDPPTPQPTCACGDPRTHGHPDNQCSGPQPDPLDENDHRDRWVTLGGSTYPLWRCGIGPHRWHSSEPRHTDGICTQGASLAEWAVGFTVTFADDPQTPPRATSVTEATEATETHPARKSLAEAADALWTATQAIRKARDEWAL